MAKCPSVQAALRLSIESAANAQCGKAVYVKDRSKYKWVHNSAPNASCANKLYGWVVIKENIAKKRIVTTVYEENEKKS